MIQFNNFPELITENNSEENYKNINILDDSNNIEFNECFNKIFVMNKMNEIDTDESECVIKEKENQNLTFNNLNNININENKEMTLDKSKQKINEDNLSEFSSILNSVGLIFDNKNNFNSIINIMNETNDNYNMIPKIEITKTQKEKDNCNNKNFFTTNCPKNFAIFNYGIYNKTSRDIIDQVLEELYQNETNKNKPEGMDNSNAIKKQNKKVKNILKRKENSDNIRKKIKTRFLKALRNRVNERLRKAGSQKLFKFLPQNFISNISKEKNKLILDLTFKEIFAKNFIKDEKECDLELKKYHHNLSVLSYLEKNKEIMENSNYIIFKDMTFSQIFKEYLISKDFEIEIASLKQEKENDKYIKDYIIKASNLLNFFSN